jgi:hypothetical protein
LIISAAAQYEPPFFSGTGASISKKGLRHIGKNTEFSYDKFFTAKNIIFAENCMKLHSQNPKVGLK